jgi:S-formylglutathione hydrolase
MESYLIRELLPLVCDMLSIDAPTIGICGHSMGGHGALTLALRYPGRFASVSALAPVAGPSRVPWGRKAFTGYLGSDAVAWAEHDASELMARQDEPPYPQGILIDQGTADKFLEEQLRPQVFEAACRKVGQPLMLRMQDGYDHSYYFISTFIEDHLRFHDERLRAARPRG